MKNKYIVALLMAMGLMGCDTATAGTESDKSEKTDTALVLGKIYNGSNSTLSFLLVTRDGQKKQMSKYVRREGDKAETDFINQGDTLLLAKNKYGFWEIAKNITMENKIKAFSRQK